MSNSPNEFDPCRPSEGGSLPTTLADFQTDPRVSWSRLTEKWTLETDDGAEYEYDDGIKRWIPVLDETLAEQQSKIYMVDGVDETTEVAPQQRNRKKRKVYTSTEDPETKEVAASKKPRAGDKKEDPAKKNRAVYITNLPPDTTEAEINDVFSKCGVIAEEIDGGKPRIKLYRNDDGTLKGDALVIYFRPESVNLAIQMLDDTDLRFGSSVTGGKVRVQAADFSYKVQQEAPVKKNHKEKKKVIAKMQKLNSKLADWDDDDPSIIPVASKQDKTVVMKHMFSLQELDEDPTAILDLKEDIREECEKLGEVTNVILYDKEKDGVVSVKFKDEAAAKACVAIMNGRFFGGQRVEAYISDGSQRFMKSHTNPSAAADEEQERLEKFGSWLESEQKEVHK